MSTNLDRKMAYAKQILREEGVLSLAAPVLRRVYLAIPLVPDLFTWIGRRSSFGFGVEKFLTFSPVNMDQSTLRRRAAMKRVLAESFRGRIDMLEVGTWFGLGSTKVWLENLPQGSSITLLDSWKPYLSKLDASPGRRGMAAMDKLHHAAIVSTLKQVYDAESDPRRNLKTTVVRGGSAHVLGTMKQESFDLIYVDGSHYYKDVKADIAHSKSLLKSSFAVLCGDDLELAPDATLIEHAKANVESDFVIHPERNGYHPGVLLAVAEELGAVNIDGGFWWVYYRNGQFSLK